MYSKFCNLLSRNLWYLLDFILDFPSFTVDRNNGSQFHLQLLSLLFHQSDSNFPNGIFLRNDYARKYHCQTRTCKIVDKRTSVLTHPHLAKVILNHPELGLSLVPAPILPASHSCQCSLQLMLRFIGFFTLHPNTSSSGSQLLSAWQAQLPTPPKLTTQHCSFRSG